MASATEAAIQDLLAKQAIRDAIYRYCRGEDRTDARLSESLWHSDGTATYGRHGALFDRPVTAWAETVHPNLARHLGSSHQVGNVLIDVKDDRAVSEAYVTARLWKRSEQGQLLVRVTIGRYLDRWSRRDGTWAVDHRHFVYDLAYDWTPTGAAENVDQLEERGPDWFEGRHGPEDPSYAVLGSLAEADRAAE